jgi:hypothetical protein
VRAVLVSPDALTEASVERRLQDLGPPPHKVGPDEEVFIAQLHRRARLLNGDFRDSVWAVVAAHEAPTGPGGRGPEERWWGPASVARSRSLARQGRTQSSGLADSWCDGDGSAPAAPENGEPVGAAASNMDGWGAASVADGQPCLPGDGVAALLGIVGGGGGRASSGLAPRPSAPSLAEPTGPPPLFRSVSAGGRLLRATTLSHSMKFTRESSAATGLTRSTATHGVGEVVCAFEGGDGGGPSAVGVWAAPAKTAARMREKLAEYAAEGAAWPLCANILDPVRASVVCSGPGQMLEVARWFLTNPSLPICKVRRARGAAASEGGVGAVFIGGRVVGGANSNRCKARGQGAE